MIFSLKGITMKDKEVLNLFLPWVNFLAEMAGPGCEVVLHDVSTPEKSVIAIRNGYHSGRDLGSPLTDLSREIIESEIYKTQEYLTNYNGVGKEKNFNSNTFFIKNNGKLVGLLCINRDLSVALEMENAIQRMIQQYNLIIPHDADYNENLSPEMDMEKMLTDRIHTVISEYGMLPSRMRLKEKVAIVHKLKDQGVLKMKGAVAEIARQLEISEPTVYRYINREL